MSSMSKYLLCSDITSDGTLDNIWHIADAHCKMKIKTLSDFVVFWGDLLHQFSG